MIRFGLSLIAAGTSKKLPRIIYGIFCGTYSKSIDHEMLTDRQIVDYAHEIGITYILLDRDSGYIDCPGASDRQMSVLFGWLVEQGESLDDFGGFSA